jgi:hypothetical protein
LKTVKLKEIAAEKSVKYTPGEEAWRALVPPDMPPLDVDSNSSSSGSFSPDEPSHSHKRGDSENSYPRVSVVRPRSGSRDLPSAEFKPPVIGKGVQTADETGQERPNFPKKSQPGSQISVKAGASQASGDSDLEDLMERFNKLK